jgi:MOSC domain-containing protein YiiM
MEKPSSILELKNQFAQAGTIQWIGLRPAKRAKLQQVSRAKLNTSVGIEGDHYSGRSGNRQVTLIQQEHLQAVASILGKPSVGPGQTRRNIVVSGINLLALKDKRFTIGDCVLEYTGLCHPCSRMEENLGTGGYNAMRGHGGINARVIKGGAIAIGDDVIARERIEESK